MYCFEHSIRAIINIAISVYLVHDPVYDDSVEVISPQVRVQSMMMIKVRHRDRCNNTT